MKHAFLVFIFSVFATMGWGQLSTPLSLVSSSGGLGQATINGNQRNVDWTLGETFVGGGTAGNFNITIGEQQGWFLTTPVKENIFTYVLVYPNPTSKFIRIDNLPAGTNTLLITDIAGKTLQTITTPDNFKIIETDNLSTGTYLLSIFDKTNTQKFTYKIVVANN